MLIQYVKHFLTESLKDPTF